MKAIRLGVVGATGLVGRTTLDVLAEWKIPLASLRVFASDASAGTAILFDKQTLKLESLSEIPANLDAAILCTSKSISCDLAQRFSAQNIVTIDHSSHFRMDASVPLVILEINSQALIGHQGIISNPNCSASIVLLPLAAIDREFGLKRVVISTYQSVSGSGQDAVAEWQAQERDSTIAARIYPRRIAHNVFPQVGPFNAKGECEEEEKVGDEIRKILNRPDLPVMTTTVRVPVHIGHSASVAVELKSNATRDDIERVFRAMPGMIYEDSDYRTPLEVSGKQEIFVSRLRLDATDSNWIQFWAVGDNLRKGAASNAIQILQAIFAD